MLSLHFWPPQKRVKALIPHNPNLSKLISIPYIPHLSAITVCYTVTSVVVYLTYIKIHKDTTFTNSHSKEEIQFVALTSISLGQCIFLLFQIVIHITLSRILCFVKISLPVEAMQAEQFSWGGLQSLSSQEISTIERFHARAS